MLDLCRLDGHHDAGRATIGIIAPVVLLENVKRLSHGFEETLRSDLYRMLDALRIPASDPACSNSHRGKVSVSYFIRYDDVP
jgi:hypothetical protein